jgi:hypothetical protein
MGTPSCRSSSHPSRTEKQGEYLALVYTYALVNRRPPAQVAIRAFFGVTPPTVHNVVVELERRVDCASRRVPRRDGEGRMLAGLRAVQRPQIALGIGVLLAVTLN